MSKCKPFVGMALLYSPGHQESITAVEGSPLAATVALVREDGLVNLSVLDSEGRTLTRSGVRFVGPDEPGPNEKSPIKRGFCTPRPAGPADDTTCLADLAARLENVEAGLAEVANRPMIAPEFAEQPPTLGIEAPAEDPPEEAGEGEESHKKRGRRR